MADRTVGMKRGRVEQIGTPQEIYGRPMTRFVAEFVGANNIMDGRVAEIGGEVITIECPSGRVFATPSREALEEEFETAERSAAETVNGLVVVADGENVLVVVSKQLQ